jgi:hypothetical protein
MAAYLPDAALDAALATLTAGSKLTFNKTAQPTTYAEAIGSTMVAHKNTPTIGTVGDRTASGGGRKRTISAVTDGVCDAAGTAGWWALVDTVGEALLAANALSATQVVAVGIPVTCTAFDIGVPDAVSE